MGCRAAVLDLTYSGSIPLRCDSARTRRTYQIKARRRDCAHGRGGIERRAISIHPIYFGLDPPTGRESFPSRYINEIGRPST